VKFSLFKFSKQYNLRFSLSAFHFVCRFEGYGCGVIAQDQVKCLLSSNYFKHCCLDINTNASPLVIDNTFDEPQCKPSAVRYKSYGYGICKGNHFINLKHTTVTCILICFDKSNSSDDGIMNCRPCLMENHYENGLIFPRSSSTIVGHEDIHISKDYNAIMVNSSAEEVLVSDYLAKNVEKLKKKNVRICLYCYSQKPCKKCSGCNYAYYCSQKCQTAHFPIHSKGCMPDYYTCHPKLPESEAN